MHDHKREEKIKKKKDGGKRLSCSCYRNLEVLKKSNGCSYRKHKRYEKEENKNYLSSYDLYVAAFIIFIFVFLIFLGMYLVCTCF